MWFGCGSSWFGGGSEVAQTCLRIWCRQSGRSSGKVVSSKRTLQKANALRATDSMGEAEVAHPLLHEGPSSSKPVQGAEARC